VFPVEMLEVWQSEAVSAERIRADDLVEGLHEAIIAADLEASLTDSAGWATVVRSIDDADAPHILTRHVSALIQRSLEATADRAQRLTLLSRLLEVLGERGRFPFPMRAAPPASSWQPTGSAPSPNRRPRGRRRPCPRRPF
jgi:hypothetical protein